MVKVSTLSITRIKPPKYKVGRYSLNEYELRCLMAEVSEGLKPSGIVVKDKDGVTAVIEDSGRLSHTLHGLDISSMYTLTLIKQMRLRN